MGMFGTVAKGALIGNLLNRLMGGRRARSSWGRSAYAARGLGGGMRGAIAAPIALSLGSWAYRKWKAKQALGQGGAGFGSSGLKPPQYPPAAH